ncbi:MAG: LysE family transporter [Deltaproteobacteria bacterium]|nr:LysE family transporter [Deltaproteobacteria bacterium]
MSAFLQGTVVGLTFAVLLGPGFFALVQTSIRSGFRAGMCLSVGIFLSDIFVLLLCYFGITQLLDVDPRHNAWFQIIGGTGLTILGFYTFNRRLVQTYPYQNRKVIGIWSKNYLYVIKGFFLNVFNPGIWVIWITAVVSISAKYGANDRSVGIFLAGILSTTLTADLLKCYVSHHIRRFCGARTITRINHAIGIILMVFGIALMLFRNDLPL